MVRPELLGRCFPFAECFPRNIPTLCFRESDAALASVGLGAWVPSSPPHLVLRKLGLTYTVLSFSSDSQLKQEKGLSRSPGGWRFAVRVSAGLGPSEASLLGL